MNVRFASRLLADSRLTIRSLCTFRCMPMEVDFRRKLTANALCQAYGQGPFSMLIFEERRLLNRTSRGWATSVLLRGSPRIVGKAALVDRRRRQARSRRLRPNRCGSIPKKPIAEAPCRQEPPLERRKYRSDRGRSERRDWCFVAANDGFAADWVEGVFFRC